MATKSTNQMKLLYTFTNAQTMIQTLIDMWWMDPMVAYSHMQGTNVEIIPQLTKTLEEYAIAKLAAKINKENMLEDYHKLQREDNNSSMVLSRSDLAKIFHQYPNCLCNKGHDGTKGLSHIITHFTETYNWPNTG
jgi:hypothetical protein